MHSATAWQLKNRAGCQVLSPSAREAVCFRKGNITPLGVVIGASRPKGSPRLVCFTRCMLIDPGVQEEGTQATVGMGQGAQEGLRRLGLEEASHLPSQECP